MQQASDNKLLRLVVEVSDDHMQARIRLSDPGDPEPLTEDEIVAALKEADVAVDDRVRERVAGFLSWIQSVEDKSERFLIAEGEPPVEGRDGEFVLHESFNSQGHDPGEDGRIDYHAFNTIITVEENTPIGTITPAKRGRNGVDVRGKILEPAHQPTEVQLDSTVRLADDDPSTVVANVAGKIVYEANALSISEVFAVRGDVDFDCGNIDASIDVSITGTILDQFKVRAKKCISVRGAIQAAEVEADGDVVVRGGIIGRDKGSVRAGGRITARFAEEADLKAGGDVTIAKEIMNSRIHCEGTAFVSHGAVIGGEVYAKEGAEIAILGTETGVHTSIVVGIHPGVLAEAERMDEETKAKLKTVERIRTSVQPLMANLKRLTPEQKERATELLFTADAMADEISKTGAQRDQMVEEARATKPPVVRVSKIIHPGARIRIGRRHVVFQNELKGPVKIEKRKIESVTEFVAVSEASGSVTVLKSANVVDDKAVEDAGARMKVER
ncbi:MAG: DUF342 domain-containing protein [Phycisphaerae bacterium]|nr:DUF342 domain-containing protein [Phycisphaerae bacterium]